MDVATHVSASRQRSNSSSAGLPPRRRINSRPQRLGGSSTREPRVTGGVTQRLQFSLPDRGAKCIESAGVNCPGCIVVKIEGGNAELVCNECDGVVGVVDFGIVGDLVAPAHAVTAGMAVDLRQTVVRVRDVKRLVERHCKPFVNRQNVADRGYLQLSAGVFFSLRRTMRKLGPKNSLNRPQL